MITSAASALAVPRRVLALKTSKTSLKTWHSRRVFKTWSQILVTLQTDLQDVTRRLGAFTLEPRRHKTLPYAASPNWQLDINSLVPCSGTVPGLKKVRVSVRSQLLTSTPEAIRLAHVQSRLFKAARHVAIHRTLLHPPGYIRLATPARRRAPLHFGHTGGSASSRLDD